MTDDVLVDIFPPGNADVLVGSSIRRPTPPFHPAPLPNPCNILPNSYTFPP